MTVEIWKAKDPTTGEEREALVIMPTRKPADLFEPLSAGKKGARRR